MIPLLSNIQNSGPVIRQVLTRKDKSSKSVLVQNLYPPVVLCLETRQPTQREFAGILEFFYGRARVALSAASAFSGMN